MPALVLVDPGIDGADLEQLAERRRPARRALWWPASRPIPHWDHLLWHSRFGDVPRYATPAAAEAATAARERAQAMAADSATGIPLDLVALLTPLSADGGPLPGELVGHDAHAVGHAALLLADRGVLLAGDMLSDRADSRCYDHAAHRAAYDAYATAARTGLEQADDDGTEVVRARSPRRRGSSVRRSNGPPRSPDRA